MSQNYHKSQRTEGQASPLCFWATEVKTNTATAAGLGSLDQTVVAQSYLSIQKVPNGIT